MINRFFQLIALVIVLLIGQSGLGQEPFEPYMVKDLLTKGQSSSIFDQIVVGENLFFTVSTAEHGRELWKSDGTEEGTKLVKDVHPGPESSQIDNLCNVNGMLFFSANDGQHGNEIWKSDGTEEGTVMIRDFSAGPLSSEIRTIVSFKGMAFFQRGRERNDTGYLAQLELYRSDGTAEGTTIVKDINPNYDYRFNPPFPLGSEPGSFLVAGEYLYFRADDGVNGRALWRTDGTEQGTLLVEESWISPGFRVVVHNKQYGVFHNDRFFFTANDQENGFGLWSTDGTPQNTAFIKSIDDAPAQYSDRVTLYGLSDRFLLLVDKELWSSDGTEAGTHLLMQDLIYRQSATVLNDKLIFTARKTGQEFGVWTSDGSIAGTFLIKNFGSYFNGPGFYALLDDVVVFKSPEHEIWITDGSQQRTAMLFEPIFGVPIPAQDAFKVLGSFAFFMMDDGIHGKELWKITKVINSERMVKDISTGTEGANIGEMYAIGDYLYFTADTIVEPNRNLPQLWRSDGTSEGTTLVWPGEVRQLKGIENSLFYIVDADNKSQLYRTFGTAEEPRLIWEDYEISLSSLTLAKNMVFFTARDENAYDSETGLYGRNSILVTAATHDEDTRVIYEVYGTSFAGDSFTQFRDGVFFAGRDREHGTELWKTDGTAGGTSLFLDIDPSYTYIYPSSSSPSWLTVYKDMLFFTAVVSGYGYELWRSDGTVEGTSLFVDLWPGLCRAWWGGYEDCSSGPFNILVVDKKLYFVAENRLYDSYWNPLLWVSDGTPFGTVPIQSSLVETLLIDPYDGGVVEFGEQLFFTGLDFSGTPSGLNDYRQNQCNYYGAELWRTDGTESGTRMLDMVPCTVADGSAWPRKLFVADDLLFFTASDGEDRALWMTDASSAEPKKLASDRGLLGFANGRVFFEDSDGIHGNELWAIQTKIFIGNCNTDVTDRLYRDRYVSDWIEDCVENEGTHDNFVSCVSKLTNDFLMNGVISGNDKGGIQRCAAAGDHF